MARHSAENKAGNWILERGKTGGIGEDMQLSIYFLVRVASVFPRSAYWSWELG